MKSKMFAERSYVWIANMCLFGVVAIAIAYDRLSMSEASKMALFWGAMALGGVSFTSYVIRRGRLAREARAARSAEVVAATMSGEVAISVADGERPAPQIKPAGTSTPVRPMSNGSIRVAKQAHRASYLADIALLEELERTYLAKQGGRYIETIRTLEQNEPVKLQELRELVYLRNASLEVLAGGISSGKARKNPGKFAKQPMHPHGTADIVDGLLV